MGIGVSLAAGTFIGIVGGIIISIVGVYSKNWWERRKAIKLQGEENILAAIKLSKEEKQNAITEERIKREGRKTSTGDVGVGTTEPNIEGGEPDTTNESSTDQRSRVQVPEPSFTLRD